MVSPKIKRRLKIAGLVVLVIQTLWIIGFYYDMENNYIKTRGTVVSFEGCAGTAVCPLYEFKDEKGSTVIEQDWFDDCKRINLFCEIFQNDIGDQATIYYPPDKPDQAIILRFNPLNPDVRFIPLQFAAMIAFVGGIIYALISYSKKENKSSSDKT